MLKIVKFFFFFFGELQVDISTVLEEAVQYVKFYSFKLREKLEDSPSKYNK